MSQKVRFFGPKEAEGENGVESILHKRVHHPSRAAKDVMLKLAREQHRRDVCNARLQDLEKELQMFSQEFGSRLHDLRAFMKDEMLYATPDIVRASFSGSLSPDEVAKAAGGGGLESSFHGEVDKVEKMNIH